MHLNEQLAAYVRGKKVAFIGAGVSHKELIPQFVEMGAKVTLCDKKPNLEAFGEYGETQKGWSAEEAKGFIKLMSTPLRVYYGKHKEEQI